jgi:hypothetical protein
MTVSGNVSTRVKLLLDVFDIAMAVCSGGVDEGSEVVHLACQFDNQTRALNVHLHRLRQFFVKFDCGGGVKNHRHSLDQTFLILK